MSDGIELSEKLFVEQRLKNRSKKNVIVPTSDFASMEHFSLPGYSISQVTMAFFYWSLFGV